MRAIEQLVDVRECEVDHNDSDHQLRQWFDAGISPEDAAQLHIEKRDARWREPSIVMPQRAFDPCADRPLTEEPPSLFPSSPALREVADAE